MKSGDQEHASRFPFILARHGGSILVRMGVRIPVADKNQRDIPQGMVYQYWQYRYGIYSTRHAGQSYRRASANGQVGYTGVINACW